MDTGAMSRLAGVRVLRGPDWQGGDSDGGEGYLGTVTQLLDNRQVRVLWDMGQESTCRAGPGHFDLRVYDVAPCGLRHPGTQCAECGQQTVWGTLWRCDLCPHADLCSLCYSDDRHDTSHQFWRVDTPGDKGQLQPKRKSSVKVRTIGLHPGAKVTRGQHWEHGDQDGGEGSEGEVQGYEDAPGAPRSMLRVQWANGWRQDCGLGVGGKVEVVCVEEEVGPFYYRDHLPLLDTTETSPLLRALSAQTLTSQTASDSSKPSPSEQNVIETCASQVITHFRENSAVGGEVAEAEELSEGDRVAIRVDEEQLQQLQTDCGGCTARMIRCIGRTGEVTNVSARGVVSVKFGAVGSAAKISYRFNRRALLKVTTSFSENDVVRIRDDLKLLKLLNRRVGWKSHMDKTAGQVGRVVRVDEDGDLRVDLQGTQHTYSPACCLPVTEATSPLPPSMPPSSPSPALASGYDQQGHSENRESEQLSLFHHVRDLIRDENHRDQGQSMRSLFAAISCDDADFVRSICHQDPTMVEREHHGLTPLIHASLKGSARSAVALMDLGADASRTVRDDRKKTPLSAVLEGKSEQLAELLLSRGANSDHVYHHGQTMAHLCVTRNKMVILQALVNYGADLNIKDDNGLSPLHLAIKIRNHEAEAVLAAAPQVNIHLGENSDFNMIQLAAFENNPKALERLLARDCSQINALRKCHSTALHIAATNDNVDCARLLVLQGGADINARQGRTKLTPLMLASHSAYLHTVEALLELGADVNLSDREGHTALHLAIGGKVEKYGKSEEAERTVAYRVQIANLLITSGACVDATDLSGQDPFCYGVSDVRNGVRAFIKHNPGVVRYRRGDAASVLHSLGVSHVSSNSPGQLRQKLQGVRLPCGLCGHPQSDVTLQPCQHWCVCRACSVKVTKCPLCDAEVKDKVICGD